jgi:hypothetical protein
MDGDMIDNFNKTGHGGGVYEQVMSTPEQKTLVRQILERIGDKVLWIVQGSHENWSFDADGFDVSQYFSNHIGGYWLGYGGMGYLKFPSGIEYSIFTTHRPPSNAKTHAFSGLRQLWPMRKFDIGISAHYHHASYAVDRYEQDVLFMTNGSLKGIDRYAGEANCMEEPLRQVGFILNPDKKLPIPFLDFRDALKYI